MGGPDLGGTGQCGQGSCTAFSVTAVDEAENVTPNLDMSSLQLSVPYLTVDEGTVYGVILKPPYSAIDAWPVQERSLILQHGSCSPKDTVCEAGTICVAYFGIAGAQGPQFRSCEIPCSGKNPCPRGQECVTVADGPGTVCW